ncbi:hypothetical protein M011DRAFT_460510 [Sporormia fimetaria CBS 119925]|uniref:Uncharacterized protein n=1 Tax=Sporormia fimetaria CBS 119925 TaxID=1340428 RepID=A0A6A6V694_9PLEO|nr:hypothetical protein M011DRAFT_460510 [Sporormia fimetaria CBS 119925]
MSEQQTDHPSEELILPPCPYGPAPEENDLPEPPVDAPELQQPSKIRALKLKLNLPEGQGGKAHSDHRTTSSHKTTSVEAVSAASNGSTRSKTPIIDGAPLLENPEDSEDDAPLIGRPRASPRVEVVKTEPMEIDLHDLDSVAGRGRSRTVSVAAMEEAPLAISWKLPEYEVISEETVIDKENQVIAKISVPGVVREEIVLDDEFPSLLLKLFQSVFLPLHQRSYTPATPDPDPRRSILNFHTISIIFIEVFRSYQDEDFKSNCIAPKDADPDEVFFAAIDNWRIGRSRKRRYQEIRGIQEFCDVGLDVLYWLKENGITEEKKKKKARSDKGIKRGPRNKKDAAEESSGADKTPQLVSSSKVVNELQARPKTKPKPKPNAPAGGRVTSGRVEKKGNVSTKATVSAEKKGKASTKATASAEKKVKASAKTTKE